jgi:hypothetical protein
MGRKALELLNEVLDQMGWHQLTTLENEDILSKDDRKAVRAMNRVLRVLSGMNDWRFLREELEIQLIAEYKLGVIRVTNGSKTVTGLDDPGTVAVDPPVWTSAMAGRVLVVSGEPHMYVINTVDSATQLTLRSNYQGTTTDGTSDAPDKAYKIAQDAYDLPTDFDRPVDEKWTLFGDSTTLPVGVVDAKTIRHRRRLRSPFLTVDEPEVVALWKQDDEGEHRVAVIDPLPRSAKLLTGDYQRLHPKIIFDTQRILFPPRFDEMIQNGIEYLLRRGPEDDDRSQLMLTEYLREREEGISKQEMGQQRTRITADRQRYKQQEFKRLVRGRTRINWGAAFDRKDFHDLG